MGISRKGHRRERFNILGLIRRSSMAWMKVFLLAFCINFGTLQGLDTRELSNEAVERGREWIWNQRDPLTDFWPRGEVITAIMGVLPDVIELRGLKYGNRTRLEGKDVVVVKTAEEQNAQSKIVAQNIERVHLEFFMKMKDNDDDISLLTDDYLSQLAMVMGLTCVHDPKDYFGYNLIDELYNRAQTAMNSEDVGVPDIQFPSLVTALCNLKDYRIVENEGWSEFLTSMINSPSEEDLGENTELNLERAAMNMIATSCLYRSNLESGEVGINIKKALATVLLHNSRFINSVQEEDGGFGNVYSTAMVLHAQRQSPYVCCKNKEKEYSNFNEDEAMEWLLDAQKSDGSFGSSIIFTSLSGLGLESAHPLDALQNLQSVDCKGNYGNQNKSKISVEFTDKIFSKMTFRESIPAEIGDNLLVLMEEYAMDNPKTLKIEGRVVEDSYYQIMAINNIQDFDDLGHSWRAYKITSDGSTEFIVDLRDAEIEDMNDIYRFEYS